MIFNIFKTLFLAFILFLNTSFADVTGKISGKIVDSNSNEPLIGANIIIQELSIGASSDEDGNYFLLNIPPGTYDVTASYIGYSQVELTGVTVNISKTTLLDFSLNVSAVEGEIVSVSAERAIIQKDLTATERVVGAEDFEKTHIRTLDEALATKAGVQDGRFRGGALNQTVYVLDKVSLNSGLMSQNYSGINTSTIQEIQVLTGGFNAEYGSAQSGIVNIVTKKAREPGLHGSVTTRLRPAGVYHWGRNFYSKDNYDWTYFGSSSYWEEQVASEGSEYFGQNAADLLAQYQQQITPDPVQGDYAERPDTEIEATIFGRIANFDLLLSHRQKKGAGMFPQSIDFNTEQNTQLKLTYNLTDKMEVELQGVYGNFINGGPMPFSSFNTQESAQEAQWSSQSFINDPYSGSKYSGIYGAWAQNPQQTNFSSTALNFTHTLSNKTFYELNVSQISDKMEKVPMGDEYQYLLNFDIASDDAYGWVSGDRPMTIDGNFDIAGHLRWTDRTQSDVTTIRGDITSQVNFNNLIKAGFSYKLYDFYYEHTMSEYEGGERWNLMNVFSGTPNEGALYIQDKIEFEGLIVNAGLRADFFSQNRQVAEDLFDPLAAYEGTNGWSGTEGVPGNPNLIDTETKVAISPRLGISHPISDQSVLHFQYGHFYQRPSWTKIFGFPYITFASGSHDELINPFDPANGTVHMDQWHGYYGNPMLDYAQTIEYEVGINQQIGQSFKIDAIVYYKDMQKQDVVNEGQSYNSDWSTPTTRTTLYNDANPYNVAVMISNMGYRDVRGFELELTSFFTGPLNFNFSYDYNRVIGGSAGFSDIFEDGQSPNLQGFNATRTPWSTAHKFKLNTNFFLQSLDLNVNLYSIWNSGEQFTYHGPGDTSTEPLNERWDPFTYSNLKVSKGFTFVGNRVEFSVDVRNVFNQNYLNLLGGDELTTYMEGGKNQDVLPVHWFSGEPDEWNWYDSMRLPQRMIYGQLKIDF